MQTLNFAAFFEQSPNPYVVLSPDFTILGANHAYLEVTGRTIEQLRGRSMFDAFPGSADGSENDPATLLRESLLRALHERRRDSIPLIRYGISRETPHGRVFEERYWSATHTPLMDADGKVTHLLQHTEDVSELQRLRALQREHDEKESSVVEARVLRRAESVQEQNRVLSQEAGALRQLFEQAPGFICVLRGPDFVYEMANDAYLTLVGRRDIVGRPRREVLPELAGQGVDAMLHRIFETGQRFTALAYPLRLQREPGAPLEERFVDLLYQPVFNERGEVSGVFVQGHDVTEQCLAQQELQRHRDQLEFMIVERTEALQRSEAERRVAQQALMQSQKMEALGKLTGGVAHDFNNVLQVIAGNLQLLGRMVGDDEAGERVQGRVQAAMAGVDRGARLASHLLAFARKQPLAPVAVNAGRLVREMDDMLRRALGASVELETVVGGGLWNTLVDPGFLENALLNLAINARDAMGGNGKLTIEAGNASLDDDYAAQHEEVIAGQYVMLAVSDTGTGMSAEVMQRAFEPFFTTKPDGLGTGLGLSMVYGFVKQSQGHVKIYSEPGHGTTIRMYLPRSMAAERLPAVSRSEAAMPGGMETILVVEDDEQVRESVVATLVELGYRVLKAADAHSALTVLESGATVDLLFTDVVMPGALRSPELARRARLLHPDIEILFTSGYTENAIVHGGRLDAGVALLSKPYRTEQLAEKLRHMLNNREQVMQLREELQRVADGRKARE